MTNKRLEVIGLALIACAFFAGTSLIAKFIAGSDGPTLHPFHVAFGRFLFGTLMLCPLFVLKGRRLVQSQVPWTYLLRSGSSVGAASCIYASVAVLPLADITAITYSSPLFMLILAVLVLRERVSKLRWTIVGFGFMGVLIMAAPTSDAFQPMALVALLGAVFMAGELIALRHIATRDSALTALFLTNAIGLVISGILSPFVWQDATAAQWQLMAAMGIITASGQVFFVRAITLGEASLLAPLFYSTLLYAAAYGYIFFGEVPSPRAVAGAIVIIVAGFLLGRTEKAPTP